jgi:putative ABC transport system substrate-binding protein
VRRREFITLISGAALTWPLAARGQQPTKLRTIGFSGLSTRSAESELVAAFTQRLHELGWIENRTVVIEYRWSEGRAERFVQIAAEFVRLKVDVIVTSGTPQVLATKQATSVIRLQMCCRLDPTPQQSQYVAALGCQIFSDGRRYSSGSHLSNEPTVHESQWLPSLRLE